ncbi:hypothetical protein AZ78_2356 [Lysobacter capsici AZ78]|uniref:Uncharacterized protein n=1 Tax=Lysobacter capsici AZ78 TaxID=1444315 RepID=A0A120AGM2_9GAMM|nr:hypothetical protein AZ78_2356 [Lysobacter capsici AZ78]
MHRTISFVRGRDKAARLQGKHGSRPFIVVSEVARYVIRYRKPQRDDRSICARVSISEV